MKYVVAENQVGAHRQRIVAPYPQWQILDKLNAGWVKLFEANTEAEAEALEALLTPAERLDRQINRS